MANLDVLCAGIVVADHVCQPVDHLPAEGELVQAEDMLLTIGGCAANVAVDLAKMDVQAAVAGRVGDDTFGRIVTELLQEHQVDVSRITTTPNCGTSQTLIINVQGQDRRFIHSFGANAQFSASDLRFDESSSAKILYVGGYCVMPALLQSELSAVLQRAQSLGMKTILDVVIPGPGEYLPLLEPLGPYVDYFLPNNLEGRLITGEESSIAQARAFRAMGMKTVIITMGGDGAVLLSENEQFRVSGYQVPCIDASGGGDAFTAGLITGLLDGKSTEDCIRTASALGAGCVQAIGTTTGAFTRAECDEFLASHSLTIEAIR